MAASRTAKLKRVTVVNVERVGQNYRLTLDCGHTRMQGSTIKVPDHVYCWECSPRRVGE